MDVHPYELAYEEPNLRVEQMLSDNDRKRMDVRQYVFAHERSNLRHRQTFSSTVCTRTHVNEYEPDRDDLSLNMF
jgi:hypothetical protein